MPRERRTIAGETRERFTSDFVFRRSRVRIGLPGSHRQTRLAIRAQVLRAAPKFSQWRAGSSVAGTCGIPPVFRADFSVRPTGVSSYRVRRTNRGRCNVGALSWRGSTVGRFSPKEFRAMRGTTCSARARFARQKLHSRTDQRVSGQSSGNSIRL